MLSWGQTLPNLDWMHQKVLKRAYLRLEACTWGKNEDYYRIINQYWPTPAACFITVWAWKLQKVQHVVSKVQTVWAHLTLLFVRNVKGKMELSNTVQLFLVQNLFLQRKGNWVQWANDLYYYFSRLTPSPKFEWGTTYTEGLVEY